MVELERHITDNSKPIYQNAEVPTLFSTGPQVPKEQLIEEHQGRGLKTKPTYV